MNTTENTTENTVEITIAPLVEAGKKQYTCGISYSEKLAIAELCLEFERPGSGNKTVKMSEKEALEVLYKVATDKRFITVPTMESIECDGESIEVQTIDADGNLVFETKDLIGEAWEEIKARDYSESVKSAKGYKLSADMISLQAKLKQEQEANEKVMKELAELRAMLASRA